MIGMILAAVVVLFLLLAVFAIAGLWVAWRWHGGGMEVAWRWRRD
jgi:hypothetical protein